MTIYFVSSCHIETVVLLGREKVDGYIDNDLDISKIEGRTGTATYPQIKDYIMEKYGFKVSSLYTLNLQISGLISDVISPYLRFLFPLALAFS